MEELINEFITKHVFPQFREVKHPFYSEPFFSICFDDNNRVACISPFDNSLAIAPFSWGSVQAMFSLTEDETIIALGRWLRKNVPLLSFDKIELLRYP